MLPLPLFLSIEFFDTTNFMKHRMVPLRSFFGSVRRHLFYRETWYSPLRHKIFGYLKLSETQKGSLTKFFETEKKNSWQENVIRLPTPSFLLPKTFSDTRIFLKHRRVPRNFSVLWDYKLTNEDREIPLWV